MKDIENKNDIKVFVNHFYSAVQQDELLGPIFNGKVGNDGWGKHLETMYSFWNSVLFAERDYHGNPFSHHISLKIDKSHFDRWVQLLTQSITTNFEGSKANEVLERANTMRILFEMKLKKIRNNPNIRPIL